MEVCKNGCGAAAGPAGLGGANLKQAASNLHTAARDSTPADFAVFLRIMHHAAATATSTPTALPTAIPAITGVDSVDPPPPPPLLFSPPPPTPS